MLKLPHKYTDDKKADAIIAWYLSRNILELVKNEIVNYETGREKEAQEDDPDFCNAVRVFFPEHYPAVKMGKAFLGLKALLKSEYEFVPELVMEYVMYYLIQMRLENADRLGMRTQEPISCQRDYVLKALRRAYPDERECSDDGEDIVRLSWREELERIEDLHYYENTYFWDFDFMLLDSHTEDELLDSLVSEYLGIENIGDGGGKFMLPPEWLNDSGIKPGQMQRTMEDEWQMAKKKKRP